MKKIHIHFVVVHTSLRSFAENPKDVGANAAEAARPTFQDSPKPDTITILVNNTGPITPILTERKLIDLDF